MPIKYKTFEAQVKAFDDENLILEHFISTEHKDRDGDVMRAKGMKVVGKPVVLLLHGRGSMGSEPVGKPLSITVDEFKGEPGILAKTQFFPDDVGRRLYGKAKGGFLPNWSIGYKVDEAKDLMREGKYDGRDVTKWQLYEYSPVGVPANPFAQTVKEFLDKVEKGEKTQAEEARWFGFVDTKECKDCGQGCTDHKPVKCVICKGELTIFKLEGVEAGRACEKCEPEEYARLDKAPATDKTDPNFQVVDEGDDPIAARAKAVGMEMEGRVAAMESQVAEMKTMMDSMDARCKKMEDAMQAMMEAMKNLEPLLKTLPPEPDGGEKGDGSQGNPPGTEEIPLLVFQPADKSEEARNKAERDQAVAAVAKAIAPIFKEQIDKIMGRVP
jgi:uncharacterized coiled-coil protein SlyX